MNALFQVLYLAILAGIVVAGTYAMCRGQKISFDQSLREALMCGGCLVLSAGVDYFMIVPSADYYIAVT